jgi:hypothetical protein
LALAQTGKNYGNKKSHIFEKYIDKPNNYEYQKTL